MSEKNPIDGLVGTDVYMPECIKGWKRGLVQRLMRGSRAVGYAPIYDDYGAARRENPTQHILTFEILAPRESKKPKLRLIEGGESSRGSA